MSFDYEFKVGIAPISWVNDDMPGLGDHYSLEQVLSEIHSLGYTATELGRTFPTDIEQLKSVLNHHQLKLASKFVGVLFSDPELRGTELAKFEEWVNFLQKMNCEHVIVCEMGNSMHWDSRNPDSGNVIPLTDEQWDSMVVGLETAGAMAEQRGMKLVFHPHGGTVVERKGEVDRLMGATNPNLVHLLYDTGHAYYGGDDPLELLHRHYDRIQYVHYKDVRQDVLKKVREEQLTFREGVLEGVFTVPGDGSIAFEPIIHELMKLGYKGWTIVEAEQDPDVAPPYQYAKMAKEYLEETINKLKSKVSSPG